MNESSESNEDGDAPPTINEVHEAEHDACVDRFENVTDDHVLFGKA